MKLSSPTDPFAKLKIIAVEGEMDGLTVEAQFNPKEVQVDKSIPWQKQVKGLGPADLEYTGCEPKSMSLELLFDAFENPRGADGKGIRGLIEKLERMTEHLSNKREEKRPPKVLVVWSIGEKNKDSGALSLPTFNAVIESMSVKYQMFAADGTVLRATASVKLKQAESLVIKKK